MPEWLTRKVGPLPVWGYALGGVVLFFLYRRGKAASTSTTGATSTVAASVPDIPTASVTTPSGFSYTGPLGGLSSLIPTGALGATNAGTANFGGLSMSGIGYGTPTAVTPGSSFVAPGGTSYAQITSQPELQQLFSQGTNVYWEPSPGTFQQAPFGLPANTPQFIATQGTQ